MAVNTEADQADWNNRIHIVDHSSLDQNRGRINNYELFNQIPLTKVRDQFHKYYQNINFLVPYPLPVCSRINSQSGRSWYNKPDLLINKQNARLPNRHGKISNHKERQELVKKRQNNGCTNANGLVPSERCHGEMESDEAECGRGPDTVLRAGNEAVGSPGARLGSPGRGLAPNSGVASPPSGNNTTTAGEINAKVKYLFIF